MLSLVCTSARKLNRTDRALDGNCLRHGPLWGRGPAEPTSCLIGGMGPGHLTCHSMFHPAALCPQALSSAQHPTAPWALTGPNPRLGDLMQAAEPPGICFLVWQNGPVVIS